MTSFSDRQGYSTSDAEIRVRDDAPEALRQTLQVICRNVGMTAKPLRTVICSVFLKAPDRDNWTEYPNISDEVDRLLRDCEWFRVYDVIEYIYQHLAKSSLYEGVQSALKFEQQLNQLFRQEGIGWQLVNGMIEVRGSEAFELAVRHGRDELMKAGRTTAATELHEAIADLSKRPDPDLTGAIQHGMAALECVARDICQSGDTLGAMVARNPGLFPKPIGSVVREAYGWASNNGRHLLEGQPPSFEEAELMVGLSGVLCRYLGRKL